MDGALWWGLVVAPVWVVWVALTTVLTYLAFPTLALPGLPVDLLVRLLFYATGCLSWTPAAVLWLRLGWVAPLALRCLAVQLAGGHLCDLLVKLLPAAGVSLPGVRSLRLVPQPLAGLLSLQIDLDGAALAGTVAAALGYDKTTLKVTSFRLDGLELFVPPLALFWELRVTVTGVTLVGDVHDAQKFAASLADDREDGAPLPPPLLSTVSLPR